MKGILGYLAALFSSLPLALERRFPILSARRAISDRRGAVIIIIIILVGAFIAYEISTLPTATTTSVYP